MPDSNPPGASVNLKAITRGAVGTPSLAFGDTTSGFWSAAANKLNAAISGNPAMTLEVNAVGMGYGVFLNGVTGASNTAYGKYALGGFAGALTGDYNIGVGHQAGYQLKGGSYNLVMGRNALSTAQADNYNIAIGDSALGVQIGATQPNLAIGVSAGGAVTTGKQNILIGHQAGKSITTGANNIAVGFNALFTTTTVGAAFNGNSVAIGTNSMFALTSGSENVGLGTSTLQALTTGVMNVALGIQAMETATFCSYCTAVGTSALDQVTTGNFNTGLGQGAGYSTTSGVFTNAITTGANCTFIGAGANPSSTTQFNYATVIGSDAAGVLFSNSVTLGRIGTDVVYAGETVLGNNASPRTVATLPAASTALKGARSFVSDATAPTFLGALTGGGAVVCPVFCNGTAWVAG